MIISNNKYPSVGYYLGQQFLSKTANIRTDEYGGSAANRCRFHLNIIKRTRELCGDDFAIIVKLSVVEQGVDGGISIPDGIYYAKKFQEAGVDAIEVLAGKWSSESGKNERPESGYKDNMTMPLCQVLKVGILELTDKLAANTGKTAQTVLMGHLKGYGAELLTECKAEKITKDSVVYTDKEGKEHTVKADTVVMAVGERPDASLYESLEGKVKELYNIGDSNGGAILPNAIYEGYTVGNQL